MATLAHSRLASGTDRRNPRASLVGGGTLWLDAWPLWHTPVWHLARLAGILAAEQLPDEEARRREVRIFPVAVLVRAREEGGARLVLVADSPIDERDIVRIHKLRPHAGAVQVQSALVRAR